MHPLATRSTFAVVLVCSLCTQLAAQARTTTQPQFKGILEPVSYSEDLDLKAVYFVNGEVGWVAGVGGTILRTVDAGKTWEAQLGGDPENKAPRVYALHFLDERRGWAIQGEGVDAYKMLHTRDGESWEEIGTVPFGANDLVFTSPETGFLSANPGMSVSGSNTIYRSTDGGRTWKLLWTCQAKVSVGGLTRNIGCLVGQIQFPTPEIGYAVIGNGCIGNGCGGPPLMAKTTDGGETWTVMNGPGVETDEVSAIFFLDEQTGFARLSSKKLHMTADGGATWRGIVASPGEAIRFADPMVGWAVALGWSDLRLSYTTDGGRRWSDRSVRLPATTRAFSLPRRDRAYVVGDNGMVFRYSVVPFAQPLGPNDKAAPAMPGFESPLDDQVEQLEQVLDEIETALGAVPEPKPGADSVAGGGAAAPDSAAGFAAADSAAAAAEGEPFDAPLTPASEFTANCCKKSFSKLETVLGALAQTLPEFIGKYRNLNLLLAAVRIGAVLPNEYRSVKGGLRAFRKAGNKEEAEGALASVSAALSALKQTTAVSMQQQLPPPPSGDFEAAPNAALSPAPGAGGAGNSVVGQAAAEAKDAVKDSSKAAGKDAVKAAADKAKKGLGSLLRKKKP
jgi:photosystem II stability/assembly factor-like uncharacterized protein